MKSKTAFNTLAILFVIAVTLHFVPIYSHKGYLNHGNANLCIGSTDPKAFSNDNYRLVFGGYSGFKNDKHMLSNSDAGCYEHVRLRLFIL